MTDLTHLLMTMAALAFGLPVLGLVAEHVHTRKLVQARIERVCRERK